MVIFNYMAGRMGVWEKKSENMVMISYFVTQKLVISHVSTIQVIALLINNQTASLNSFLLNSFTKNVWKINLECNLYSSSGPSELVRRSSSGPSELVRRSSSGPSEQLRRSSSGPSDQLLQTLFGDYINNWTGVFQTIKPR